MGLRNQKNLYLLCCSKHTAIFKADISLYLIHTLHAEKLIPLVSTALTIPFISPIR